jgi:hypothetical protein
VFNIVKNVLEDVKNFVFFFWYFIWETLEDKQGMLGNTKKMAKTLEQCWVDLKGVKQCWQNIGRCGELLILILLFLTMMMGHSENVDRHCVTLVKHWGTLNNIEKTLKNIKHSWQNLAECQLASKNLWETPRKL